MSFRVRVLVLVSVVAVGAVAATAYLAFTQAEKQVTESAAADQQTVARILDRLTDYGRRSGTWEGVSPVVEELARGSGQRIKLATDTGEVVVDTDTLAGRTARAVPAGPLPVDVRPRIVLPRSTLRAGDRRPFDATLHAIRRYRSGVRFAACLTRWGLPVAVRPGEHGVPDHVPDRMAVESDPDRVERCREVFLATDGITVDADEVGSCSRFATEAVKPGDQPALLDCLARAFAWRTEEVAPRPLQVYLGATDEPRRSLAPAPIVGAAGLVALLALAGTALLSRRVLRPIGALTAASERLGEGDLTLRVSATGRDELATLARSFNRMADSLQRGEERQRRLVADVAHELRTPLANLRGYLEALKDGVMPPSPELFASLHEEAVLQQRIVDDLQDLALAEAGALAYHRTRVDLAELVETCRTAHQAAADAAGVDLQVRADGPVTVDADPDRLRQVIGNLIANALRATPPDGSVTLSAAAAGDRATVEVRDTGVGITAANLPHVFDRFWRADPARGRATGGSGLGLAIARQIVTDHDGRITADSVAGAGTTVTLTLPLPPHTS